MIGQWKLLSSAGMYIKLTRHCKDIYNRQNQNQHNPEPYQTRGAMRTVIIPVHTHVKHDSLGDWWRQFKNDVVFRSCKLSLARVTPNKMNKLFRWKWQPFCHGVLSFALWFVVFIEVHHLDCDSSLCFFPLNLALTLNSKTMPIGRFSNFQVIRKRFLLQIGKTEITCLCVDHQKASLVQNVFIGAYARRDQV